MLSDNSFQSLSDPIIGISESLTLVLLEMIKKIAKHLADDPQAFVNIYAETRKTLKEWQAFNKQAQAWADVALAKAYLKGIQAVNAEAPKGLKASHGVGESILAPSGGGSGISSVAEAILSDYPEHHTMYSVFQEQAYRSFNDTRVPVIRDVQGKIRDLIVKASDPEYRNADNFTRRELSQSLMNEFAKNNIAGVKYSDGRTMKIDSYSEMVARSQTGNAAREAALRRQQQYGLDLVQISVHYPCSDLCEPYQGHVFSISGTSSKYPALNEAISGGLYHANCKHFQSGYIDGTSRLPEKELNRTKNRQQYQAQKRQRAIERKIRDYKRREASALTQKEAKKARNYIKKWQKQQRRLINDHPFLRRKYSRERV